VSISTIYRTVRDLLKATKQKPSHKQFKAYDPGFLHIDISYLPKINKVRTYLFVAIDRATRSIFYYIYEDKSSESAVDFLEKCIGFFSFKTTKILTDNGLEFSSKIYKNKKGLPAIKKHIFAQKCSEYDIIHRFTPIFHPQTNGMVERVNRTIKDKTIHKQNFNSIEEMKNCFCDFFGFYNLERKHRGLVKEIKLKTALDALSFWFEKKPELFITEPKIFKEKVVNYSKNKLTKIGNNLVKSNILFI
jgi:transposase InsO family protein